MAHRRTLRLQPSLSADMTALRGAPLSKASTIRIGGPARLLIDVRSPVDLWDAFEWLESCRPDRLLVIGQGSNLLPPDSSYDGVVVRVTTRSEPVAQQLGNGAVQAFGGTSLDALTRWALDQGLTGLEWAGGLPGTIGAAVRGNAGAFGHEIAECVLEATAVSVDSPRGRVRIFDHLNLDFAYRTSAIKRERLWIVAAVTLQLRQSGGDELEAARSRYGETIAYRRARHPLEYPNCGSVFKNLDDPRLIAQVFDYWPAIEEKVRTDWHGKVPMGYVIGRLGLAGNRAGRAEISTKHHNFIVNLGGARSVDVLSLVARVRSAMEGTFGSTPEAEPEIIESGHLWSTSDALPVHV